MATSSQPRGQRHQVILDVDTGTDDAMAILYAVAHPEIDLLAITCVAGNSGVEQVVANTLRVLDAAGAADVPVAAGAAQPLVERGRPEGHFHGVDGLGGVRLPDTARRPTGASAVELLHATLQSATGPVTLVALAPQTNLALLFALHPDDRERIGRLVFMGGSASGGNVTAVAEFNVWQDPEAAAAVIQSGLPTSMYGLDVFTRLLIDRADADRLSADEHPGRRLAGELLHRRGSRSDGSATDYGGILGDCGALIYLTDPDLFVAEQHPVRVNLSGLGRGQTIVDRRAVRQDAGAWAADPWPVLDVVLDGRLDAAADVFLATLALLRS